MAKLILLTVIAAILVCSEVHSKCLDQDPQVIRRAIYNDKEIALTIEQGSWDTSGLHSTIVHFLLTEVLGYNATLNTDYGGEGFVFRRVAGCPGTETDYPTCDAAALLDVPLTLINMEVWPGGKESEHQKWVTSTKLVEDMGILGVIGRVGWYTFSQVVEDQWSSNRYVLENYRSLNTSALDIFERVHPSASIDAAAAATCAGPYEQFGCIDGWFHSPTCNNSNNIGSCAAIYYVSPDYTTNVLNQLVYNLNLNLSAAWLGDDFYSHILTAAGSNSPVLFSYWEPDAFLTKFDATRISLPAYDSDNYAAAQDAGVWGPVKTDYPSDILMKMAWPKLKEVAPDAYALVRSYTFTNSEVNALLKKHINGVGTMTMEEVACDWLKNNTAKWSLWVPSAPVCTASYWRYNVSECDTAGFRTVTYYWNTINSFGNGSLECVGGEALPSVTWISCEFTPSESVAAAVVTAFNSVLLALTAGSVGVLLLYRSRTVISRSQPVFLFTLGVGAMFAFTFVYILSGEPTDAVCAFRPILLCLAFTLVYGSVFAKTYRIWRLFNNPKLRRVTFTSRQASTSLIAFLVVDAIILSIWMGVDRPQAVIDTGTVAGIGLVPIRACASQTSLAQMFPVLLYFYKFIVLVAGAVVAFRVRKVNEDFQEAKWIGMTIYNSVVIALIVVPAAYTMPLSSLALYGLISAGVMVCSFLSVVFIIFTRLRTLKRTGHYVLPDVATNGGASTIGSGADDGPMSGLSSSIRADSVPRSQ